MNTTDELLQQLNTMQSEHIKILEERIKVLTQTIKNLNNKSNEQTATTLN